MASDEALAAYLNDHLAGAAAGIELAEKLRGNNQGTELGQVMATLHADISEDREAAVAAGATWFVCKPIDGRRFRSEVQQLADRWAVPA